MASARSTKAANSDRKRSAENRSAFARQSAARILCRGASNARTASAIASAVCRPKNEPVVAEVPAPHTVSSAPPRPYAITGVPQACASTGRMPKSSSAAKTKARACRAIRADALSAPPRRIARSVRRQRARARLPGRRRRRSGDGLEARGTRRRRGRPACRAPSGGGDVRGAQCRFRRAGAGVKKSTSTGGWITAASRP